jgi:molybdopterin/thiamine biosynthesis adenylyltransferase
MAEDRYRDNRVVLGEQLLESVHSAKILVVGSGGIGCELLKNLVLSGFHDIEIVSNPQYGVFRCFKITEYIFLRST